MSITYRSIKGSKLTSNELDGNFSYLEALIGGNGNVLVTKMGFNLVSQELTINSGWIWKILGVSYTNASDVTITIPYAASGKTRIDLIVANQSNTLIRVPGVESESTPVTPSLPINTILVTFYEVTDGVIEVPSDPIVGTQFKKKSESLVYSYPLLSGANAVIQLRPEGNSYYEIGNNDLISIDGFGLNLITGNISAEVPYAMKDLIISNIGTTAIVLKHNGPGTANSKFFFLNEQDFVIPPGGKVWFKFGLPYCFFIFKSWASDSLTLDDITNEGTITENTIEVGGLYTPEVFFKDVLGNVIARLYANNIDISDFELPDNSGKLTTEDVVIDLITQINELKQDKLFFLKKANGIVSVTGTLSETQVYREFFRISSNMGENAYGLGFFLNIFSLFTKLGTASGYTIRVKLSTSSTMPSGSTDQIALYNGSTSIIYAPISRIFSIIRPVNLGNMQLHGFPFTLSSINDANISTTASSSRDVLYGNIYYLYVSVQLNTSTADTVNFVSLKASNV